MDKVLQSLNIKLDSTMQTLAERAIGQLLVKIIFNSSDSISENELLEKYKDEVKNSYNEDSVKRILSLMVNENQIKFEKKKYRISTSKRNSIEKNIQGSKDRLNNIIEKYFTELYSSKELITDCLIDSTTRFFETYSSEWIADLNYSERYVLNSKDNIIRTIGLRIAANKKIDNRDKQRILEKFINFITTRNDSDVDGFLWEYGTSAFAAKLIKVSNASDTLSIKKFSNSKCILDTNILMNIGLEASKYSTAISSIEKAFLNLNIKVGILNVTKEEYEHTIINKKNTVLKLVSKGYSNDVLKETDDQYILTALDRKCDRLEDFERFFEQIESVPKMFDKHIAIEIFNHDEDLNKTIKTFQGDDGRLESLNAIYRKVTQKDKNPNSLRHDVGMIAGAEYLRTKEKVFILSQEISVNNYSKELPLEDGLPLSIKLETLINVLSINTDGVNDDNSYIGLFASMVRSGLTVQKDVFKAEDLHYMLEKEEQITHLPADVTISIANKIHAMRVKGEPDNSIHLTLTREITGGKLRIKDDLDKAKVDISIEKRKNEFYQEEIERSNRTLFDIFTKESEKEYKQEIRNVYYRIFYMLIPILLVTIFLFILLQNNPESVNVFWNVIICLIVNILSNSLWYLYDITPKIKQLKKEKGNIISAKVAEKQVKYRNK